MRFFIRVVLILTFTLSAAYATQEQTVGDWIISPGNGLYEAYTANESGSTLGVICTVDDCSFYLRAGTSCEKDASYTTLINSDSGAAVYDLKCTPLTINGQLEYVMLIGDLKSFGNVLLNSSTVGFAMPLQSGQFKVSRFSLSGFPNAIKIIGDLRKKGHARPRNAGNTDIRDSTL